MKQSGNWKKNWTNLILKKQSLIKRPGLRSLLELVVTVKRIDKTFDQKLRNFSEKEILNLPL
jgi:hypothetical protein